MFIDNLIINGYGPFHECEVLSGDGCKNKSLVTIVIGENGAGKTIFLEAIRTLLSWLTARIRNERSAGSPIESHRIHNGSHYAKLSCTIHAEGNDYSWSLIKSKQRTPQKYESDLRDSSKLARIYSTNIYNNSMASLPLIAYYPTERYVLDIPKRIRKCHDFSQLDEYDGVFNKGIDFRRFFEWFRNREDIINEKKLSLDEIENIQKYIDKTKLNDEIKYDDSTQNVG